MKTAVRTLLGLVVVFAVVAMARSQDDKKGAKLKTLKGELACPHCVFELEGIKGKGCHNAIKVKEGGKDVYYIFVDNKRKEKYHGPICKATKKGSVMGEVVEAPKGYPKEYKYIKPKAGSVKFDD